MIEKLICRQEADSPQGGGVAPVSAPQAPSDPFAGARTSAEARLQGSPSPEPAAPTDNPPTPDGSPPVEPAGTPSGPQDGIEFDYKGQRTKLSRDEAVRLIHHTLEAYERAEAIRAQGGLGYQPPQAREPQGAPPNPLANLPPETAQALEAWVNSKLEPYEERIAAHDRRAEDIQRQRDIEGMLRETDTAMAKQEIFKTLEPEDQQMFRGMVLYVKALNENMSWDGAAERIAKVMQKRERDAQGRFLEGKIQAAARKVEGQGGVPPVTQGKKPSRKDMYDGTLERRALERLMKTASQ